MPSPTDPTQLSLPLMLLVPVVLAIFVVALAHIVIMRLNPSLRDTKSTKKSAVAQQAKSRSGNDFVMSTPPITGNFDPAICPVFESTSDVRVTRQTTANEFVLDFTKQAFVSITAHAPVSTNWNAMRVEVLSSERDTTVVALGYSRSPYPSWRLPGWHPHSLAFHTNNRKFVDKGDYIGEPFPLAPSDDLSVAKSCANTYDLVCNLTDNEVYVVQGADPVIFHRVLATRNEFRPSPETVYFPALGANGKCRVRVTMYSADYTKIKQRAYEQEKSTQQTVSRQQSASAPSGLPEIVQFASPSQHAMSSPYTLPTSGSTTHPSFGVHPNSPARPLPQALGTSSSHTLTSSQHSLAQSPSVQFRQ